MARVRFFLMVAFVAAGCTLLIASYAPRVATAVWVGSVSHRSIFLPDRDNARYELSSRVITQPGVRS